MIVRFGLSVGFFGLLSWSSVQLAHAQDYAQQPAALPVRIRAGAGERVELLRREDRTPVATCRSSCVELLPPGQYQLQLWGSDEKLIGERRMKLREPVIWTVTPQSPTARNTGLALGIAGTALFLGGVILTLPVVMASMCHDSEGCTTDAERSRAQLGIPLVIGGAIMAPLGWVMFGRNFRPRVQVSPYEVQRSAATSRFRVGIELAF